MDTKEKMYYSKTTNGFYSKEVNGDSIPFDAVEITNEQHAALLQGQAAGKLISSQGGAPVLIDAPAPKPETPAMQLARLDSDNALTQRNLRDFIMLTAAAIKAGQPVDLTQIPGVAKVVAVEAQAAALRAKL